MTDGAYLSTVYTVEKSVMLKEMYEKKKLQEKTPTNVHLIGFKYWHDVEAWMTVFGKDFFESEGYEYYSLTFLRRTRLNN